MRKGFQKLKANTMNRLSIVSTLIGVVLICQCALAANPNSVINELSSIEKQLEAGSPRYRIELLYTPSSVTDVRKDFDENDAFFALTLHSSVWKNSGEELSAALSHGQLIASARPGAFRARVNIIDIQTRSPVISVAVDFVNEIVQINGENFVEPPPVRDWFENNLLRLFRTVNRGVPIGRF
jgi:hypothetical protein